MRTSIFILIVLASGTFAGLVQGTANLAVVEPFLDRATEIENQALFASGQESDSSQFQIEYETYRMWQKGGQVLAAVIHGTAVSALFGIVFVLSRQSLPGRNDLVRSVILAGMMWAVLYVVPFLKYPASLPGTGDGETLVVRSALYLSLVAVSGFGALGFHRLSRRLEGRRKAVALAGYAALVAAAFLAMPGNPDDAGTPSDLLNAFRAAAFLTMTAFWASVGVIMGLLWIWLRPDIREARQYK